jgi:cytosine/adenosine deaminase-related metal-dependent hydrolase
MATRNGAAALGQRDALGCLAPGAYVDMIALPVSAVGDIYENIVAFPGNVPWIMVNGEVRETAG